MKGMGKYTNFEMELSHLSIDELNELYLSGGLDKAYDDYERTGEVQRLKPVQKRKGNRKVRGEK
jgi:hypothetical protein